MIILRQLKSRACLWLFVQHFQLFTLKGRLFVWQNGKPIKRLYVVEWKMYD